MRLKYKNILSILLAATVMVVSAACAKPEETTPSTEPSSSTVSSSSSSVSSSTPPLSSSSEEPVSSSSRELLPGEPEYIDPGIELETKHITFYYPEELAQDLIIRETTEDGIQRIRFSGMFGGEELELFSILFGPPGPEDFALGVIHDEEAGEAEVSIRMNVQNAEDWSAEDFARINALQERVNDFIIQFYEDPRFSPDG